MTSTAPRFAFLALGEAHQLFHILGPAAALARNGHDVTFLVSSVWHERIVAQYAPHSGLTIERLRTLPQRDASISATPSRLSTLVLNAHRFAGFEVLVTPERSSTLLKRLGLFRGKLAHIPHGAGDREAGYDPRIRYFDLVFVAGEKDRRRMIARGLVREDACIVAGYAKFDLIKDPPPRFFDNDNPVVLYNPHFDARLSSWPAMGPDLVSAFEMEESCNFIVAPHIRMRGTLRESFDALAARNTKTHIRFDSGSLHSVNMDYTRSAALYLGDVSSQVYEFIRTPKPCVFLNPRGVAWRNDEHYAHWHFGPVATTVGEAMSLMRSGLNAPGDFTSAQREGLREAIVQSSATASEEIAAVLSNVR